jgi:cyclopropane fatty-acyl-phospholipid synthase-like methyltransferase
MFRFVTKKEYWEVVDSGIIKDIPHKFDWHLKSIQDAIAFSFLNKMKNKSLAEIGGGNSRLLPFLAKTNSCYNIEEFKGMGGGPKQEIKLNGVINCLTNIGDFSDSIENEQFDVIFSISVVEHVSSEKLTDFFKDSYRILRPSGLMIHLIDVYLEDQLGNNKGSSERVLSYASFLDGTLFKPVEPPTILSEKEVVFSTSFATNPDNMMNQWNHSVPSLRGKRERAQSCSLLMVGRKTG